MTQLVKLQDGCEESEFGLLIKSAMETVELINASSSSVQDVKEAEFDSLFLLRQKPTSRKKTWGIFYTPATIIQHLTEWAIRFPSDTILEPSFGGCGFLDSCADRLSKLKADHPWRQMCGCDIDTRALSNLPVRFQNVENNSRFLLKNFLETQPSDYAIKEYSVIIGNPPYVSRHNMMQYQLRSAENVSKNSNITLGRHASLWAYFVIHSLRFLAPNGRMAWVLPRTLSQGTYGKNLLLDLGKRFKKILVISLKHRAFVSEGAEELVDILLCDGFEPPKASITTPNFSFINHISEIPDAIIRTPTSKDRIGRMQIVNDEEAAAINEFVKRSEAQSLSTYADAKIGIVTGASAFFVLKKSALMGAKLKQEHCKFLLTKSRYINGLCLLEDDIKRLIDEDKKVLLVNPISENASYWNQFPETSKQKVRTFQKRPIWNAPDDGRVPDGFFPPLVNELARISLNKAGANSSNSVHRVYFKIEVSEPIRLSIILAFLTSFVQLSCELQGRQCGSGGLKFEPSDFGTLLMPTFTEKHQKTVHETFHEADELTRAGFNEAAINLANQWLFSGYGYPQAAPNGELIKNALLRLRLARSR